MRNYHWTLSIALLATAGCHDITITLDDGDGIGINFGGGLTVGVDDGHDDDATAGEELPPLGAYIADVLSLQAMVTSDLEAQIPMTLTASLLTGADTWDVNIGEISTIQPTVADGPQTKPIIVIDPTGGGTGPTVPTTPDTDEQPTADNGFGVSVEYYVTKDGVESYHVSTFALDVDAAGNVVLGCEYVLPEGTGTEETLPTRDGGTFEPSETITESLDPCGQEAEDEVEAALTAVILDLGAAEETTGWSDSPIWTWLFGCIESFWNDPTNLSCGNPFEIN